MLFELKVSHFTGIHGQMVKIDLANSFICHMVS